VPAATSASSPPTTDYSRFKFRIGSTGLGPFNTKSTPGDNVLIFPLYGGQSYYGSQASSIDEPNSFIQAEAKIGDAKSYTFVGLAWFKEKMQPSSNGYKIEAPTDFLATIGKEFKIASPVKGLNITGDVSLGAGGVFGAPLFQPASSGTVNLRGFHIDLGDPYYAVGLAGLLFLG